MNRTYINTVAASEQLFSTSADDSSSFCESPKREHFTSSTNNAPVFSWPSTVTDNNDRSNDEQVNLLDVLGPTDLDISNIVGQAIWQVDNSPTQPPERNSNDFSHSMISFDNLFEHWNNNIQVPPTIKEEWGSVNSIPLKQEPQEFSLPYQPEEQQPFKLPLTPPFDTGNTFQPNDSIKSSFSFTAEPMSISNTNTDFNEFYPNVPLQQVSREITPPASATVSSSASGSNSPHSSVSTPPSIVQYLPHIPQQHLINNLSPNTLVNTLSTPTKGRSPARRKSTDGHSTPARTYRRRASSHPSVASVVSLSAHEPVAKIVNGVEHITFLYSHDRLVKEYTVRTDVDSVNLDNIPADFRVPNAIYPRANVSREQYDGNRWEYETSCNKLGWELCWLNQEQLCGRRGLIQRAVDSYRNRHAEMRSRRVTRQEKVANGTLRKRRAKKAHSAIL